jgi:hypothetical protein
MNFEFQKQLRRCKAALVWHCENLEYLGPEPIHTAPRETQHPFKRALGALWK